MALTTDQIAELKAYQDLVNGLTAILSTQVYIDPTIANVRGISNANIVSINDAIDTVLQAIEDLITEVV